MVNCFKLKPSEYLVFNFKNKKLNKFIYWKTNFEETKINKKKFQGDFMNLFKNSIDNHLRSDVPIGIYLSGGIDSTSIAFLATNKLGYDNLTAFNLKFGDSTFDEDIAAKKTAKNLNIKLISHKIELSDQLKKVKTLIENLDEPLADPGYLAIGMVAEVAKNYSPRELISES